MVRSSSIDRVLEKLVQNQEFGNVRDNCVRSVSREIDLDRDTVTEAVSMLQDWGVVEKSKVGRRKEIRVHSAVVERFKDVQEEPKSLDEKKLA